MNNELVRFFNSINFEDKENIFENASVLKVILKKKEELFEVNLVNDSVIEYKYVKKLFDAAKKGINGEKGLKSMPSSAGVTISWFLRI